MIEAITIPIQLCLFQNNNFNGLLPNVKYVKPLIDNPEFIKEVASSNIVSYVAMNNSNLISNLINVQHYNDLLKLFLVTGYVWRYCY